MMSAFNFPALTTPTDEFFQFGPHPVHHPQRRDAPVLDIVESDDVTVLFFELPGAPKDSIKISLHGYTLTVQGEIPRSVISATVPGTFKERGRSYGHFTKVLSLSHLVLASELRASFDNGVLRIEVPHKSKVVGGKAEQVALQ